jgi:hypothetical protein
VGAAPDWANGAHLTGPPTHDARVARRRPRRHRMEADDG